MSKLPKKTFIGIDDFSAAILGPIKFNGVTHETLVEFYDITEKQKETLFDIQKKLDNLNKIPQQKMEIFLDTLAKLHQELKNTPDFDSFVIKTGTGRDPKIIVSCECELKIQYQTESQLSSKSRAKNKL